MSCSAPLSDAQKKQRRQRFFQAISSTSSQDSSTTEADKAIFASEQAQQTWSTLVASSSASASTTSLSPEQIEDLLKLLKPKGKLTSPTEPEFNELTLEQQQASRNAQQKLLFAPPTTLDAAARAKQKEMFDDLRRQDFLLKASMESLPPILQAIKMQIEEREKQIMEADGTQDCERQINALLRSHGEPEIPFETFITPPYQDNRRPGAAYLGERIRLKALQRHKPALFAQVWPLLEQYSDAPQQYKLNLS